MKRSSPQLIKNTLLDLIKNQKKPISATKQLKISKQLLSYHLRQMTKKGLIRKKGFGVWEIVKDSTKSTSQGNIRGHGFTWIINVPKNTKNWNKREQLLTKNKIKFKLTGNTIRIIVKGKKVWLNNNSIIIFDSNSFRATTPLETRKMAIYELLTTIKSVESKIKLKLPKYQFKSNREHYALVKNGLAIQCNKEGEKIHLYDNNEWWGVVDDSFNQDEFEFMKTKSYSGLTNSTGANGYFNSHKDTNWKVTPDFILNRMNDLIQDRIFWAEHQKSHIASIQTLAKEVKGLGKVIKSIKKENETMKTKLSKQSSLSDF